MDVHVKTTNEKTSFLLQTLGLVCSQTQFIIYPWKEMQQYRKGDAVLLPRLFAFPASSSDQKDFSKVMKKNWIWIWSNLIVIHLHISKKRFWILWSIFRHLRSMRPLLDDREYEEMVRLSAQFENTIASRLQRYLWLKWIWSDNYVSDWWEEYVYLSSRAPLMINSNYYCLDVICNDEPLFKQVIN